MAAWPSGLPPMSAFPSAYTGPGFPGTWNGDGVPTRMPLQPPGANAAFGNYLTSVLPSQYSAYTPLDSPCPQQPFAAAFEDIRTDECIFYLASPPISRISCMCTSFYQDMLDVVTASWPAQCGSGDLANLAIAKGTQAVADVCSWQSNEAATVPVTGPYDVPSHSAIYQTPASLYATITSSSAYYYGITPAPSASFQSFASTNTRPYATPAQGVAEITRRPDSRELSGATVVGLAVGCTVLGLIMIAIPILVMIRKRKALLTNREQNSLAEEVYQDEKPRIETQTLPAYSKPPSYSEGKSKAV